MFVDWAWHLDMQVLYLIGLGAVGIYALIKRKR